MSNSLLPPQAPTPKRRRSLLGRFFVPPGKPGDVIIYCHSNLFYWWPVWAVSFVLAVITYFEDRHLAVVPAGTVAARGRLVEVEPGGKTESRDVLILKEGASLPAKVGEEAAGPAQPGIFISGQKTLGVVFMGILLLVIVITNVPLRGLWSLLTILVLLTLGLMLALLGVWEHIFAGSKLLAIYINLGGYLFLAIALFIVWLINFVVFDRQFYVVATPGQILVHLNIGGGEVAYDASGAVFQKKRSDLFRHWFLGFGSGDLVIRPVNAREPIELHNVLRVGRRVRQIEQRIKEKEIVAAV